MSNEPTGTPHRWRIGRHELLAIFGFWTLFAVLTTANRLLDGYGPTSLRAELDETFYWFFQSYLWAAVTPLIFWLAWRFGGERTRPVVQVPLFLAAGVLIVLATTAMRHLVWFEVLQLPLFGRPGQPLTLARILFRPWFLHDLVTYAGVLAVGFARLYFLRYRARQQEMASLHAHTALLQAQLSDARLDALRMQLNPHFLFNTLHAVSSLVERDPRGVRRMIARLSELLRYTLNGSDQQEVTLEEELHVLQRYLEIMEIRFQGRLEVDVETDAAVRDALVPTLILQPLVENAVKHGLANRLEAGHIEVRATRHGDRLVLLVRDNGVGLRPESAGAQGTGVGLRNVRARLEQLYDEEQSLTLAAAQGGGAVATIELPYHTRAELRAGVDDEPAHSPAGSAR